MEKAKILIAEDEKPQRDLLEGFLQKEGFSVDAVSNGRQALQKLEENFFDIALIDYKISKEARALLLRYPYPGNVRELENLIERAVVLCRGDVITTQDLPFHLQEGKPERSWEAQKTVRSLPESLEEIERDLIVKALHEHKGIQIKAAEGLGISERVLRYKIKKYRIRFNPPSPPFTKGGLGGLSDEGLK